MLPFYYSYFISPLGPMRIKATENSIYEILFVDEASDSDMHQPPVLLECIKQLEDYFAGHIRQFTIAVNPGGTPFQQAVWEQLMALPYGNTTTYLKLAELSGEAKNTRAIAGAIAKNPLAVLIPCHRVLGSNGSLTGYAWGLVRKQWLIDHEARCNGSYMKLF